MVNTNSGLNNANFSCIINAVVNSISVILTKCIKTISHKYFPVKQFFITTILKHAYSYSHIGLFVQNIIYQAITLQSQ